MHPTTEQIAAAEAEEREAEAFVGAQWKAADEYLTAEWPDATDETRATVRSAWTELARRHRDELPAAPRCFEGMHPVPCAVNAAGWLYIPHADGKWVSAAKLEPFSMAIIYHWREAQRASGVMGTTNDQPKGGA